MPPQTAIPFDKSDSFDPLILPLANLAVGASVQQGLRGYGVYYLSALSQPGALLLINQRVPLYPGAFFEGEFEGLQVELHPQNTQLAGNAFLLIKKKPNISFFEPQWNPQPLNNVTTLFDGSIATADITGFHWVGRNGLVAAFASVLPFDFTGFSQIQATLQWTSLVGSGGPNFTMFGLGNNAPSPFFQIYALTTTSANISTPAHTSAGMYIGKNLQFQIDSASAGGNQYNPNYIMTPQWAPYGAIELGSFVGFTSIGTGRLTVYGIT